MTTTTKEERLSALVDDEAEAFETRRLLDELTKNPEDLAQWGRYHLIGDVMRGNLQHTAPPDFSARIMAAVAEEPPLTAPSPPWYGRLLKPAAGMGMAAAVAVAVLVGLQNFAGGLAEPEPALAAADPVIRAAQWDTGQRHVLQSMFEPNPLSAPVQHSPLELSTPPVLPIDMDDARFSSYLLNHAEWAVGRGGIPPQVRTVGHGFVGD
ncbi:sigma-E factor negative regulatory protein RseA [Ectothiorhodospira magna]|uniref:Sigma-E factor negative regulatory protein RseA n=1 Tax=Ectothiorhodospira magna TaxID=867345 RepID=A0A1H9CFA9_9GAMM|nr:sigma-E factor negative regulatory protein [Ectothiorhodospira magna]SEP99834.1 sigma-E factor negative regulatory protein RseA [Ectothiorhodospira magna]